MKVLNYKNNFLLWFDIIFRPRRILRAIRQYLKSKESELESKVNEKIDLLYYQQFEKGIVKGINQEPVLRIPIEGIDKHGPLDSFTNASIIVHEKQIKSISTSYASCMTPIDMIKEDAAHALSKKLINEGFLSSTISRNIITFSVNCFGIE